MQTKNVCSGESKVEASRALDAVAAGRMLDPEADVRALAKLEALREMSALRDFVDEPLPFAFAFAFENGVEFDADEFASVALDAE